MNRLFANSEIAVFVGRNRIDSSKLFYSFIKSNNILSYLCMYDCMCVCYVVCLVHNHSDGGLSKFFFYFVQNIPLGPNVYEFAVDFFAGRSISVDFSKKKMYWIQIEIKIPSFFVSTL